MSPPAIGFVRGIAQFLHLNLWNLNGYINNFPNLNSKQEQFRSERISTPDTSKIKTLGRLLSS
jgi:hypothetical protein